MTVIQGDVRYCPANVALSAASATFSTGSHASILPVFEQASHPLPSQSGHVSRVRISRVKRFALGEQPGAAAHECCRRDDDKNEGGDVAHQDPLPVGHDSESRR